MLLGIMPTPEGIAGGSNAVFIKFGGFGFYVYNYDFDKSYGYGEPYFYPLTGGVPYDLYSPSAHFSVDYFDIDSNNELYKAEVERLKKAFKVGSNCKFNAIGYTSQIRFGWDYSFEHVFAFDFHDIFKTFIVDTVSYSDNVVLNQGHPFINSVLNVSDSLVGGDGSKTEINYTESLYSPVDFVERSPWGSTWNWYAGVGVLVFEFNTHYSVLVPNSVPNLRHPLSGGTILGASFNHHKIIKNSKCCLAEIFGITQ